MIQEIAESGILETTSWLEAQSSTPTSQRIQCGALGDWHELLACGTVVDSTGASTQ
jgi:hypothetical protein